MAGGGGGYWLAAADGGVFSFGSAPFYGSLPSIGIHPTAPIVGIAATTDGGGYWLVDADGGVFSFGDAVFYGSLPAEHVAPHEPIVGMAPDADGHGYWLASADGGVFGFGTSYFGSLPGIGIHPAAPIVGIAAAQVVSRCPSTNPDTTEGYWLASADGGVFSFGSATFEGSSAGGALAAPIVGIASGTQPLATCPAQAP